MTHHPATWRPTKSSEKREVHPYEVYVAVQNQKSLLQDYLWKMTLLDKYEQGALRSEIARLSRWINEHDYVLQKDIYTEERLII